MSPDLKLGWSRLPLVSNKPIFWESLNPSNFFGFRSWVSGWVVTKCWGNLKPSKTRFPAHRSLPCGYPKLKTWTRSRIDGHFFVCGFGTVPVLGIWYCRRVRFEGIWYCIGKGRGRLRCAENLVFEGFSFPQYFVTTHPLTQLQKPKKFEGFKDSQKSDPFGHEMAIYFIPASNLDSAVSRIPCARHQLVTHAYKSYKDLKIL